MPNFATSEYRITGDAKELDALYELMKKLSNEKPNGNWVGHIVQALNADEIPEHLYVRGWWDSLMREEGNLYFHQESAWEPLYEAWDFIASKFNTLDVYFVGEEPGCEVYLKRDHPTERWFSYNYFVELHTPDGNESCEYFDTLGQAFRFVERLTDANIITMDDIEGLNAAWEEHEGAYIYPELFIKV